MLSVVHNCNYLLSLLLIHSLRTSICACKYLYMLSGTNSVFHHFPWLGLMTLTFPLPSPGPQPLLSHYGISFLGSNVHPLTFLRRKAHQSQIQIWICPLSHESPWCMKLMQFKWNFLSCAPVDKGLVPIHYKYFVRNLTFASFSVEPWGVEHARFNKPYKLHIE